MEMIQCLQLRCAGEKYYLIDCKGGSAPYHRPILINDVGAEIFRYLKENNSMEETARMMAEEYGVETARIRNDIEAFLLDLKNRYTVWE